MRIGIDARFWNQSGIGRYLRNLIFHLQKIDSKNDYYLFLLPEDFDQLNLAKNFHKVLANFKWYGIEEQIKLPKLLEKYNLDLVHFPHFNVPIFYNGKFIVTIHDLIHQHSSNYSSTHNPLIFHLKKIGYNLVFSQAVKKSQKIITVSNFVKQQLIDDWKVPVKKVEVTYEAVEENLLIEAKNITSSQTKNVLTKFQISPPFIFYVGNVHPHKNVERLIESFLELRKNYQYLQLVLSGKENYFWKRLKAKYQNKNIICTGFITDQELVALYKSASAFVLPSKEEGFGIPILEAFACGCPVVSSNKASLPEVGGDAAIYFDPENLNEIQEKIAQVLNNSKLKQHLINQGLKRVKQFDWNKLAEQTLQVYQDIR